MSINPNVLLRIFENSKPETCDEIELDSNKRFYTQGQVKQIQEAVKLYVDRKKILEDNIGANSNIVEALKGILKDLGDVNDFITNRIANNDEIRTKDELIEMKDIYLKNHKEFEKEYKNFFDNQLNKAIENNPFTVSIQQADGLNDKFDYMEDRNDEYTQEPFKSLLKCASFVKTREELLQKLFKLFTGLAALDNAATRKKFPMNFWDPTVIAADVIQNIENAIKIREKAIQNYKVEYNINNAEDFVRANGQNFPTLEEEVFNYKTTIVNDMSRRIQVLASKRQQTQASIQAAKDRYKSTFINSPDNVKSQIDDFNDERLINQQKNKRKDLLKQLNMIRSNPPQGEVYKNMLDSALENILQKREDLLKKYEKTFNFTIENNDNRGLYQALDNDIQIKIDKRKKLLEEAENYYTPEKLNKINKNEAINSKFEILIGKRKTLVDKLNKYRADIDKGDWKELDDTDLEELVEKREKAVNGLKNTFESATDLLFKQEINVLKKEKLKELATERNEILNKLKQSYTGEDEDLPLNYESKSLGDIKNILNERLKQYEEVARKVKELSGNTNTDPLTNDPKLKDLKEELTKLEEERIILEARLKILKLPIQQLWTQESIQTNQKLEEFINNGSTTNDLTKEIQLIQKNIDVIDTSISNGLDEITTNPGNISNIKKIYKEETDAFDLEKKKFAELQNRIKNDTSIFDTNKQLLNAEITKVEKTIKEVVEKIENLGVIIKKQEKSRREIDEIVSEIYIVSFQPNINTTTVKNILAEEIIKSKNNDNENGSLKNIVLNKEGFNVDGDTLSKGYYPVLWLQTFTNIDDTDNKRLRFISRYDGQQVLGYASNEALFDATKTGFAWSEQGKNGSIFWVNGWCRITINENITPRGQIILDELGLGIIKSNQTLYINLENRTEILARTEFLEKLKNNLEKFGDYEKRSVTKNVKYNVKVQNWFDGANFAKVPLDEVEHIDFSGSNSNPIKYLIAPSRDEFINSIRKQYKKVNANVDKYPDSQSRATIQDLFDVLFPKAGNARSGVSWNGQETNAIDLTDEKRWSDTTFAENLSKKDNSIGKVVKSQNNTLQIVDSLEKMKAVEGTFTRDDIINAFWNQIKFELVDGGSPRILVHRISKYEKLQRESAEPEKSKTEFYVECISDGGEGYCLKYDTTVAENISSFFDEEKKLFIFKDEDDVRSRNAKALTTSSLVKEELLDTDDESVQTFRFVPNI